MAKEIGFVLVFAFMLLCAFANMFGVSLELVTPWMIWLVIGGAVGDLCEGPWPWWASFLLVLGGGIGFGIPAVIGHHQGLAHDAIAMAGMAIGLEVGKYIRAKRTKNS